MTAQEFDKLKQIATEVYDNEKEFLSLVTDRLEIELKCLETRTHFFGTHAREFYDQAARQFGRRHEEYYSLTRSCIVTLVDHPDVLKVPSFAVAVQLCAGLAYAKVMNAILASVLSVGATGRDKGESRLDALQSRFPDYEHLSSPGHLTSLEELYDSDLMPGMNPPQSKGRQQELQHLSQEGQPRSSLKGNNERDRLAVLQEEAWEAFSRDFDELLHTHLGKCVAYRGPMRLCFADTWSDLHDECTRRGFQSEELLVARIEPGALEIPEVTLLEAFPENQA